MTIDEQIKLFESNAEFERKDGDLQGCLNFRQLVEWLKDYKRLLGAIEDIRTDIKHKADNCDIFIGADESDLEWGKYSAYVDTLYIIHKHLRKKQENEK